MPPPLTGALTFLFTDIEGSTARWKTQREAMAATLVRHDAILRGAIEGLRAEEAKGNGASGEAAARDTVLPVVRCRWSDSVT